MSTVASRRAFILAASLIALAACPGLSQAALISIKVPLSTAQCVPLVEGAGTGMAELTYDAETRVVTWDITYSGLSGRATMAHLHKGTATQGGKTPHLAWLSKQGSPVDNPIKGEATLTPEDAQLFTVGESYINVHTQANPGCEIRGQVIFPKS